MAHRITNQTYNATASGSDGVPAGIRLQDTVPERISLMQFQEADMKRCPPGAVGMQCEMRTSEHEAAMARFMPMTIRETPHDEDEFKEEPAQYSSYA
jgi:hypothetical protein